LEPVSLPVSIMKCSKTMVLLLHSVGEGSTWLFKAKVISSTVEQCYLELGYQYNKLHLSQTYITILLLLRFFCLKSWFPELFKMSLKGPRFKTEIDFFTFSIWNLVVIGAKETTEAEILSLDWLSTSNPPSPHPLSKIIELLYNNLQ